MSNTTSLVAELENRELSGDSDAKKYSDRFKTMKTYLENNYYPYIQANCSWFTDHGKTHIDGVLWSAGQLLQGCLSKTGCLTTFDLYLLMTAIIWHDAGMVAKRRGHEGAVQKFLEEMGQTVFDDLIEKRLVEEIVGAHTGRGKIQGLRNEERVGIYTIYPRALAGILRFADEVSENYSRISQPLIKNGSVPSDHLIYWQYAACVKASHPDPARERVILTLEMDRDIAVQEFHFPEQDRKISLVEYVMTRIEKVVCERAYCAPHFLRYVSIQSIELRLSLVKGTRRFPEFDKNLEFTNYDYPEVKIKDSFFKENPQWHVDQLRQLA